MQRLLLPIAAAGWLVCQGAPALAETAWPELKERSFSPEVAEFLRPKDGYRAFEQGDIAVADSLKKQVADCLAAGPIEPCIGMILAGHIWIDDPVRTEEAMAAAERMFPVDPLVVPGDRRIAGSDAVVLAGLRRLKQIADLSLNLHGQADPRTIRRNLAFDTALWRAGDNPVHTLSTLETVEKAHGAGGEVTGRAKALAAVSNDWVTQAPGWAADAHRILGGKGAPVLAALRLKNGNYREAEQLAFDGYAAVSAERAQDDPATLAAAALLAKVYAERGKSDLARPLARRIAEAREQDRHSTALQKVDALMALADLVSAEERAPLLRRALALLDAQKGKPQWPLAAHLQREIAAGMSFNDEFLDGFMQQGVKRIDEDGERALASLRSRILTTLGFDQLAKNPKQAESLLKQAIAADTLNRPAKSFFALAIMASARDLGELNRGGEESVEYLLQSAENPNLPEDHPERILNAMLFAGYFMRWNANYAPEHARKAAAAAARRVTAYDTLDEQAMSELNSLRSVFAIQVQSNWAAQQSAR